MLASSLLLFPAGGSIAAEKDTIVVSQASDVLTLDPMLDTSPISFNVFRNIFDALTRIEADGSVAPLLAQSWTPSAEATVWDFTIRSGAKFHNGQPVTAQDVAWSYQRLAERNEVSGQNVYFESEIGRGGRAKQGSLYPLRALCAVRSAGFAHFNRAQESI